MTDGYQDPPPVPEGVPQPEYFPLRMTVLEKYNISPGLFAIIALFAVFVLYQIVGGVLTLLLFGLKPTAQNIGGFRIATGVGQILFILLPTLILVRFATFAPADYLRVRKPRVLSLFLALVGIFSLQQVLQLFMTLQDKIPLPSSIQ